jgi:hypothetical protein
MRSATPCCRCPLFPADPLVKYWLSTHLLDPSGRPKTSVRVSHAASLTWIRRTHQRLTSAHWVDGPIAQSTSKTSLSGGGTCVPKSRQSGERSFFSAQAAVAFQRYRFGERPFDDTASAHDEARTEPQGLSVSLAWRGDHASEPGLGDGQKRMGTKQSVEGEVFVGVSLQLKQLLERHDGQSRSVPTRTICMIERDDSDRGSNSNGELH